MESMRFPPGSRRFTREGHSLVVMQYTRKIAIIFTTEIFLVVRRRNGFKILDSTQHAKLLGRHATADALLSAVFGRASIDVVIKELYALLPQPIAEEIEEYYGWMPLGALPIVPF